MFKNTYKKKLKALLEGLECEHINMFMSFAKTKDYKILGEAYVSAVNAKIVEASQYKRGK